MRGIGKKLPVRGAAEVLPDGTKRGSVKNFHAGCHGPAKTEKFLVQVGLVETTGTRAFAPRVDYDEIQLKIAV